jgi:hypothetical protein
MPHGSEALEWGSCSETLSLNKQKKFYLHCQRQNLESPTGSRDKQWKETMSWPTWYDWAPGWDEGYGHSKCRDWPGHHQWCKGQNSGHCSTSRWATCTEWTSHQAQYLLSYISVKLDRTRATKLDRLEKSVILVEVSSKSFQILILVEGKYQKHTIHQDQFPMTAAYGFTDYWSQGQTILYVLVDIVSPPTGTLSLFNIYVALSRSLGWSTIRLLLEFWWETLSKFSWHMAIRWRWQAGQTISDHEGLVDQDDQKRRLEDIYFQEVVVWIITKIRTLAFS